MSNTKNEKPLAYYTVDNFIAESCKLIGEPVRGVYSKPTYESAYMGYVTSFAKALGIDDPLYMNLNYAVNTKYHTLLAPPTFLVTFKYPISNGALYDGPYPLVGLEAAFDWQWQDVIRMNDSFTTEHILTDVYERPSDKGRTVYLVSECKYWNKVSKELVATCKGTYAAIALAESITEVPEAMTEGFRKCSLTDRKVYKYTEEEVKNLLNDVDAEVRNGPASRYWEEVNVGDKLQPVVKGPLTTSDQMNYAKMIFSASAFPGFGLRFLEGLKTPGFLRINTLMGWPYDVEMNAHLDPNMSGALGMPDQFALGTLKAGICTHLLSNWMGDGGFIRRLNVDVLETFLYADTLWISGEVVEKYKEKLGGELLKAVDVKIDSVNQLGNKVVSGSATVYLPSAGHEVKLPIPQ